MDIEIKEKVIFSHTYFLMISYIKNISLFLLSILKHKEINLFKLKKKKINKD